MSRPLVVPAFGVRVAMHRIARAGRQGNEQHGELAYLNRHELAIAVA